MPDDPIPPDPEGPPSQRAAEPATSPAAPAEPADIGYTPGGVPTFESVREKIETRYGTALGAEELARETPEGRTVEEQYDERQRTAAKRLEEIRESMREENP